MFRMMTPIDAIGLSLRAGMMFGQTQTLWMTRMMEMQGFWIGIPKITSADLPPPASSDADDVAVVLPPLTEIHVEALAAVAEAAAKPAPVEEVVEAAVEPVAAVEAVAEAMVEPAVEPVAAFVPVADLPPVVVAPEAVAAPVVEPEVAPEPAPVVVAAAEPAPAVVPLATAKSKRPRKSADSAE